MFFVGMLVGIIMGICGCYAYTGYKANKGTPVPENDTDYLGV